MATFKVGDRVRLTDEGLAHWGDQASGTTGTITPESDEDGWVCVEWGNGRTECYRPSVDLTLADAPAPTGPRYVVKQVADAHPDEPGIWCDGQNAPPDIAGKLNSGGACSWRFSSLSDERRRRSPEYPIAAGIIDAHDAWHRANTTAPPPPAPVAPKPSKSVLDARAPLAPDVLADAEDGPPPAAGRLLKSTPIKTAPVEPPRPSDARICEHWAFVAHEVETGRSTPVGARLDASFRLVFVRVDDTNFAAAPRPRPRRSGCASWSSARTEARMTSEPTSLQPRAGRHRRSHAERCCDPPRHHRHAHGRARCGGPRA